MERDFEKRPRKETLSLRLSPWRETQRKDTRGTEKRDLGERPRKET